MSDGYDDGGALAEAKADLDAANTVYRGLALAGNRARRGNAEYAAIDRLRREAYQMVEACWDVLLAAQKGQAKPRKVRRLTNEERGVEMTVYKCGW